MGYQYKPQVSIPVTVALAILAAVLSFYNNLPTGSMESIVALAVSAGLSTGISHYEAEAGTADATATTTPTAKVKLVPQTTQPTAEQVTAFTDALKAFNSAKSAANADSNISTTTADAAKKTAVIAALQAALQALSQ